MKKILHFIYTLLIVAATIAQTQVAYYPFNSNAGSHDYLIAKKTTSLAQSTGESFTVASSFGNPEGVKVYRIEEPPVTLKGRTGVGGNTKYFDVFQSGGTAPQCTW